MLGAIGGVGRPSGGVRGAFGAGRECRCSGASRSIGHQGALGAHRCWGPLGTLRAVRGCRDVRVYWSWQGV